MKLAALLFVGVGMLGAQTWCYGNSGTAVSGCIEIARLDPSVLLGPAGKPVYRVTVGVGTSDPWATVLAVAIEISLSDGKTFTINRLLTASVPFGTPIYFEATLPGAPAPEAMKSFNIIRQHAEPKDELINQVASRSSCSTEHAR
jgi:hypothetical protein